MLKGGKRGREKGKDREQVGKREGRVWQWPVISVLATHSLASPFVLCLHFKGNCQNSGGGEHTRAPSRS